MDAVSLDRLKAKIDTLNGQVACIEALWDGNQDGWFIVMSVVMRVDEAFLVHFLGTFTYGGDLRLFNGQAPPWPEALHAVDVGEKLANHYEALFYFPSKHEPDDLQPSWLASSSCG